MRQEKTVTIDGQVHTVVISDEQEALLAADAAGRAIIGLWSPGRDGQDLSLADYLVERPEDADEEYLERVVRRKLGLPWIIGETKRLLIREFSVEDAAQVPAKESAGPADRVFYTPELLKDYIRCQYGFCQYGIWALVRKADGQLVGKAGITDMPELPSGTADAADMPGTAVGITGPALELGYHIFAPFRRQGYATEACREILNYARTHMGGPIYARIDASNEASIRLAAACGFRRLFSENIANQGDTVVYIGGVADESQETR